MSSSRRATHVKRVRWLVPAFTLAGAIAAACHDAGAAGAATSHVTPSRSIGSPNHGRLEGGVHLERSPSVRWVAAYDNGDARWGSRELVEAIDRASREVKRRYPDAVLGAGQLSRRTGGDIDRHRSHESGRDADLAFYLVDRTGKAVNRERFVAIRPDGIGASDPSVRFDDGRNWALVSALVTDPHARVTHIFVETHLRTRLLAFGARAGASTELRARVAEVLMQPHHVLPHDDHFHIRIACPTTSPTCIEWPTATTPHAAPHTTPPNANARLKVTKPTHVAGHRAVRARSTGRAQIEAIPLPPLGTAPAPVSVMTASASDTTTRWIDGTSAPSTTASPSPEPPPDSNAAWRAPE